MIVVGLSTVISTVLTQDCDRITTCVDGQPLVNCSMVNGRQIAVYILENVPVNSTIYCLDDRIFFPNATSYETPSQSFLQHFSINTTGDIVVIMSPDYEDSSQIQGFIRGVAVDGSRSDQVTLTVNIVNVNEFSPQLTAGLERSFVLTEGKETPESFVAFRISDEDGTSNITYNISGTGSEEFFVDSSIGITLKYHEGLELDRERYSMYQLTIRAIDNLEPVKYSNPINVNVTVEDINDNAPRFTNNRTFTIPTVLQADEFVGNASASDPDAGENGTITYNIISVQFSQDDLLYINSTTGILYTTERYIEHVFTEGIRNISVEIMARDNGDVPMNSIATFVLVLQRPPQFSNDTYVFSLEENKNGSVGNVTASFADGDSVSFLYQVEPSARNRFTVDNVTGEVSAIVSLDRENSSMESFTVMAVGEIDPRLVSTAKVKINVLDQNDQTPQFGQKEYDFAITTAERVAGTISATDNDIGNNSVITFSIVTNFDIPLNISKADNNTAEIIVIDRTKIGTFVFTVMATDVGGLHDTTRVNVTISMGPQDMGDDGNMTTIIVVVVTTISIVVILLILLIMFCLCWRRRNRSGQFSVNKQKSSFNGYATADSDYVPARKKSILKVPSGDNGKFGSPSCSEAASERVKFEPRANMVMFELDQPTIRKEASITTDTKLGSGDDSSICSGHNKHVDRDEGLILRSRNTLLNRATLSSNITDSDDEDDFPSISRNQLYTANNLRTQPPQPAPIGATNHAYSPPLSHRYNPVTPIVHPAPPLVDGSQMLSSENLDRHNRAMAKRHRKVPSDQYSETSDGTGTYFTSDAEDGSAYGEPPATWTTL